LTSRRGRAPFPPRARAPVRRHGRALEKRY
jgi:hypothetical protein